MMLFTLECISFNNIRAHALVLWVNSQRSNRSDHDTRISYHGWVASKKILKAPPPPPFFFFCRPAHVRIQLLASPGDFLFRPVLGACSQATSGCFVALA